MENSILDIDKPRCPLRQTAHPVLDTGSDGCKRPRVKHGVCESGRGGFTLVEVAIVLVIIGSLIAGIVSLLSITQKSDKAQQTKDNLEVVEEALLSFYKTNGYLPCPASRTDAIGSATYGVSTDCTASEASTCTGSPKACEDIDVGSNSIRIGAIPNRSLNISDKYSIDGWGNKLTYVAIKEMAEINADIPHDQADGGVIQIFDGTGTTIPDDLQMVDDSTCTDKTDCPLVSYVITSHGESGRGALTLNGKRISCASNTLDKSNCDDDEEFVDSNINRTSGASFFDDIIRWKTHKQIEAVND